MVGYHKRFVDNFSKIALSLTNSINKTTSFVWDVKYHESFEREVDYNAGLKYSQPGEDVCKLLRFTFTWFV